VAAVMLGSVALNAWLGLTVMNRVTGVFTLAFAVWLIGFRPHSRTSPNLRLLDFGLGLWCLLGAWYMLGSWAR
jgi:hypothetical protein